MFSDESESDIDYDCLCREEVENYDSNYKYQQTIWNELEAEISTAGLGKNQGADDPQADESEDEMMEPPYS